MLFYNVNDLLVKEEFFNWNSITDDWAVSGRTNINYNSNNDLTYVLSERWDSQKGWENQSEQNRYYDLDGYELAYEYWYLWNATTGNFDFGYREEYSCKGMTISLKETNETQLQVYPNPSSANQNLTINSPKNSHYTLYNTQGKTVQEGWLKKGVNTLMLPTHSNGLYILQTAMGTARLLIQ